jgi:O-acetyl-ADP-ribose deacetylase (regulator of RNase III)
MDARLNIEFVDTNPAVVSALQDAFRGVPRVAARVGNVTERPLPDAFVSPANSFGFMDGGVDQAYMRFFDWEAQNAVRQWLDGEFFGELPVGQATAVCTRTGLPWLIVAPTMRTPRNIAGTPNVYLAFRAALATALGTPELWHAGLPRIRCPGMGTGIGGVAPTTAASQMRAAYDAVFAPARRMGSAEVHAHVARTEAA